MSSDCSEAMSCYTLLFPQPGRTLKCESGYKVAVDFYSLEYEFILTYIIFPPIVATFI